MNKAIPNTFDELFPSPFLKSNDIGNEDLHLTISRFDFEILGQGDQAERKGVLDFQETPKRLVLNMTNASIIAEIYGSIISGWIGKRIAVYRTEVPFGGKMVPAVRVRTTPPQAPQALIQGNEPSGPVYPT